MSSFFVLKMFSDLQRVSDFGSRHSQFIQSSNSAQNAFQNQQNSLSQTLDQNGIIYKTKNRSCITSNTSKIMFRFLGNAFGSQCCASVGNSRETVTEFTDRSSQNISSILQETEKYMSRGLKVRHKCVFMTFLFFWHLCIFMMTFLFV